MAAIHVPCFRYRGDDCSAEIEVEATSTSGAEGPLRVRCPYRNRLYLLTPEEHVRQALLWFLREGSQRASSWKQAIRVEVEQRSLDVALSLPRASREALFDPPLTAAVVETKYLGYAATTDQGVAVQILTYLQRERCPAGLIFTGEQAIWLRATANSDQPYAREILGDLLEVEAHIEAAVAHAEARRQALTEKFELARGGDYHSMLDLVSALGVDLSLTFTMSLRQNGGPTRVQGFLLRAPADGIITYALRGIQSRRSPRFSQAEFRALLSVLPLDR